MEYIYNTESKNKGIKTFQSQYIFLQKVYIHIWMSVNIE